MAVYPSNMAPFGLKLWENAFQTIPNISFFDVEKFCSTKILDEFVSQKQNWRKINKYVFSRSYAGLSMIGRSAIRNHSLKCVYFIDTTLGEGVNNSISVLDLDLAPKLTLTIWAS